VSQPAFWEVAYQQGRCGWDLGGPAPAFLDLLMGDEAPAPGPLLVPGCGQGHDALLFARYGFAVTGVDFAPSAVAAATARAAQAGLPTTFVEADLFSLGQRWPGTFAYVAEHTCFCAIDPARRAEYVRVVHDLLRPGGELLAIFSVHTRGGGPPFATTADEVRALFSPRFTIRSLAPTTSSAPPRQGQELFGRLVRGGQ
jgi:SAM-dependent methyltransferase